MKQKTLAQGAEATIILEGDKIIKDRTPKSYRIKVLDEKIRTRRTKSETKILEKASKIINTPKPEKYKEKTKITMPYIEGKKLSTNLNKFPLTKQKQVCKLIGGAVAKLHKEDIIHQDLTTSNMIYQEKENKLFIIDFGLAFQNGKYEDKAVDLHLLKQALEAKHFQNHETLFKEIKKAYKKHNKEEAEKIFQKLIEVEKRGRYKH